MAHYRHRVFLYVTRGDVLLVLRHVDFADVPLQVPGGTIEPGESPALAARREAFEETGIEELPEPALLVTDIVAMQSGDREETVEASYSRFDVENMHLPENWQHVEQHAGGAGPVRFELFWIPLSGSEALSSADRLMLYKVGCQSR